MPLIQGHIFQWRERAEVVYMHPEVERTPLIADTAIAYAHMIDIGVDFKLDPAAVARTFVGFLHPFSS